MYRNILFSCVVAGLFSASGLSAQPADTTIYVNPGNGYTLHDALRAAREYKRLHTTADGYQFYTKTLSTYPKVTISLAAGRYEISEPLVLRPEDSNLTIEAPSGAEIVGSRQVVLTATKGKKEFTSGPLEFNGNIPRFRQLWINGRKAMWCRSVDDLNKMPRILNYDKNRQILWLYGKDISQTFIDYIHKGKQFAGNHPEMILHQMWEVSNLRIKDMWREGDSVAVTFQDPEARVQFQHPWPGPMYKSKHDSPYLFQNCRLLLDKPGEWWYSQNDGIYYLPQRDEAKAKLTADVPMFENLVRVEGTQERLVSNITFKGITFSYTTWNRPSFEGHVPLQAGMYLTEAYKLRPKIDRTDNHKLDNQGWLGRSRAAVEVSYGSNVDFSNCKFIHLGGAALDYVEGCKGGTASNCSFSDIGMSGVVCGSFSPAGLETHLPYQVGDVRVVCDSQAIKNSEFTNIGTEDWGCTAIAAGYVSRIRIEGNNIHDVPYTGISLGWGWNRTTCCMHDNYVARNTITNFAMRMTDCAGIYTLGNQPGTVIEQNDVSVCNPPVYVHDPNHWFWLYTDEGSSNITLRNNRVPGDKFLKNANGPGNIWENNGPDVKIEK